jgi:MSHA biogenesis protein MshJ
MKAQLERLAKRFNALAVRERAIAFASVLLVAVVLLYLIALEPGLAKKRRLAAQLADAQRGVLTLQSLKTPTQDPLVARRAERDALRRQLAEIDKTMGEIQRGLVPAERTARLLEEVLGSSRGLQLVSLRTLPVQRFDPAGGGAEANANAPRDAERQLYQHTFEMTLQGSYADLHDYLRRVEQLPWRLFWSRISVAVNEDQQAKLVVTLTVRTLSVSKAWLIV